MLCACGRRAFSHVLSMVALYRKCPRALTLENMRQVLASLVCWLPLHVVVWCLGRRAVREAQHVDRSCPSYSDPATDWARALRSIWSDCTAWRASGGGGAGGGGGGKPGRRSRTWGAGTWGGSRADRGLGVDFGADRGLGVDFLGEKVSVVGLLHRPELNGVHGRIFGVEEDTGRFIVRLQGVAGNVSVRPQNLVRLVRVGRYLHFKF